MLKLVKCILQDGAQTQILYKSLLKELYTSIKPLNYDISIYDIQYAPSWSYQGTVRILVQIVEDTNDIQINSHELEIHEVEISSANLKEPFKASKISYNEKQHRAIFAFSETVPKSSEAIIIAKFSGTINNKMCGFYRSKYKPTVPAAESVPRDDENHYMFSTQFEACDARRAFPCFDEPNLKATFDLEIEVPEDQVALSNMPERATRPGSKAGLKVVKFEQTPKMSTYLLAWAFGDFTHVEAFTKRKYKGKNLPVRVYTTRGLEDQGQWALENAYQIIDLYSNVFKIDYPLPKSDLLCVHEFSHGAMENWGLVTYRATAVLFDEAKSDMLYKNRVAYVVAHELAHQWFGNLVTMDWWDELWLNEGFATWVGWFALDHLYPEWNVWGQFVTESMQRAYGLDSLRSSHPIEVPVRDALEVDQIFDAVSYQKGSSCIRMLSAHIGADVFLTGVSNYLKAHAYGNARTQDLWSALSEASGKDVSGFMDKWIKAIGFPVLTVAEEPGQITIQQSRFLLTGDVTAEDDKTTWWIPLGFRSGNKPSAARVSTTDQAQALSTKEETIRNIDTTFYKINTDNAAFFRTNYPPARLATLGQQRSSLSVADRIGLISDAAALAVSGYGTTPALLGLLEAFPDETNKLVWSEIVASLGNVRMIFDSGPVSAALEAFALRLVSPAVERIGWDYPADEDYLTAQLRALLILTAGLAGHKGIIAEAKRKFVAYVGGDRTAVHQSLRSAVFRIAMVNGGREEYEALKKEYLAPISADHGEIALMALGRVPTEELGREFCRFILDSVKLGETYYGFLTLGQNAKTKRMLWEYTKENWTEMRKVLGANMTVMDVFIRMSLNRYSDVKIADDMDHFFKDKDNSGYDKALKVVNDTIRGNAKYKERDEKVILEFLQAHGYA